MTSTAGHLVLSGADVVLPDRILSKGTVVIDGRTIVDVRMESASPRDVRATDLSGHYIVPGFVDVHVHGVEGHDSQEGPSAIAEIARRMPRYGVTAFCPTMVACAPEELRQVLDAVRAARVERLISSARVLPAHYESNFISPEYRGAQPITCLRVPAEGTRVPGAAVPGADYGAEEILAEFERAQPDLGIVTVAPELDGGLPLVRRLVAAGHIVSLGHSGASFEEGMAAIVAGARHATHLFNRMPQLHHREPGLAAAVLQEDDVAAELVCDAYHVHPAMLRVAIAAKGPSRVMAITDGTAASGLPVGARATLGGCTIEARETAAFLEDNTLAGSTATMDRAFRVLVNVVGLSLVEAATLCATTPARELKLVGHGTITPGAVADLTVLDSNLQVVQTYIDGVAALSHGPHHS